MSDRIITDLQEDLANRLRGDDFLYYVPVVTERTHAIQSVVDSHLAGIAAQNGKSGLACIVTQPVANVNAPNAPGANMDVIFVVKILENVVVNMAATGTTIAALTLARRVARVLHHYIPKGLGNPVVCESPSIIGVGDEQGRVCYEVHFKTSEADGTVYTKVAMPTISPADSGGGYPLTITLACATAGASIYYTTDDTLPRPAVGALAGNGTLYTAPFALASAAPVRACAYKSGSLASNTERVKYS